MFYKSTDLLTSRMLNNNNNYYYDYYYYRYYKIIIIVLFMCLQHSRLHSKVLIKLLSVFIFRNTSVDFFRIVFKNKMQRVVLPSKDDIVKYTFIT